MLQKMCFGVCGGNDEDLRTNTERKHVKMSRKGMKQGQYGQKNAGMWLAVSFVFKGALVNFVPLFTCLSRY